MALVLFKRYHTNEIATLPIVDGQLVWDMDTGQTYMDVGTNRIETGGGAYNLPIATDSILGGIKSGGDITVDTVTGVVTVNDDSHNHVIGNITGLQAILDSKAPLYNPDFSGTPKIGGVNIVSDNNYVHTDNNFTNEEKSKLSGIEAGAQANVIEKIEVNGEELIPEEKTVSIETVPTGGAAGQVLAKKTSDNYDVEWVTGSGGGATLPDNLAYLGDDVGVTSLGVDADTLGGQLPSYYATQSDMNVISNDRGYLNTKVIDSGSANDITLNGKYIAYGGNVSELPLNTEWFFVDVSSDESNDYVSQFAKSAYHNKYYMRCKSLEESGWTTWQELATTNKLYNPNILHNWDFRNLVNQRNLLSYTTAGYTADRWSLDLNGGSAEVTIQDGFLRLARTAITATAAQSLRQTIENGYLLSGKTVTLSVKHRNTQLGQMLIFAAGVVINTIALPISSDWRITKLTTTLPTITSAQNLHVYIYWGLSNQVSLTGYTDFQSIKLELGSISTLANDSPSDYGEQLSLCQRYFYRKNGFWQVRASGIATNEIRFTLELPTPMRISPTISNAEFKVYNLSTVTETTGFSFAITGTFQSNNNSLTITATKTAHGLTDAAIMIPSSGHADFSAEL